jgi:predicted component of type VI protein secretion system
VTTDELAHAAQPIDDIDRDPPRPVSALRCADSRLSADVTVRRLSKPGRAAMSAYWHWPRSESTPPRKKNAKQKTADSLERRAGVAADIYTAT